MGAKERGGEGRGREVSGGVGGRRGGGRGWEGKIGGRVREGEG